jgi:ELWxxDGT repeat protein
MVKDINPSASSSPSNLTNINGTLFFRANDGTNGDELWKSDGTPGGTVMVKDIYTGSSNSSYPAEFTSVNGTVFFRAEDGTHGNELWKSDGPSYDDAAMVEDIKPGADSSYPYNLTDFNGTLFFSPNYGTGYALWKYSFDFPWAMFLPAIIKKSAP